MKLKYKNDKLEDGEKTLVYGMKLKNGDTLDFSKFGDKQRHFETKALNSKMFTRVGDDNQDIEDGEIIEEEKLTSAQIREKLDERGIEYKSSASKAELQALLEESEEDDANA